MKSALFSVYLLIDPTTGGARYVGRTNRPLAVRLREHVLKARKGASNHTAHWIRQLLARNLLPIISLLELTHDPQAREVFWVSHYRQANCSLTNQTDGGEGTWGYKRPPDQIRRGEANPTAKLTWEQVRAIRAESPDQSLVEIAAKYHVSWGAIQSIMTGKTWKEDPLPASIAPVKRRPPGELRRGERNSSAKLTWDQVRTIRVAASDMTFRELAADYGVSLPVICGIVAGEIWKDPSYVPLKSRVERGLPRHPNQPRGPGSYPNRKPLAGTLNPKAKLTEAQVLEIRSLKGRQRVQETADQFGVGTSTIYEIQNGITWTHTPGVDLQRQHPRVPTKRPPMSEECREKRSAALKGRPKSEVTRQKMSASNKARAKLSDDQVREIRRLYADGQANVPQMARAFGVGRTNIYGIVRGERRTDVQ